MATLLWDLGRVITFTHPSRDMLLSKTEVLDKIQRLTSRVLFAL